MCSSIASTPSSAAGLELGRIRIEKQAHDDAGAFEPANRFGHLLAVAPTTSRPPSVVTSSRRSGTSVA